MWITVAILRENYDRSEPYIESTFDTSATYDGEGRSGYAFHAHDKIWNLEVTTPEPGKSRASLFVRTKGEDTSRLVACGPLTMKWPFVRHSFGGPDGKGEQYQVRFTEHED